MAQQPPFSRFGLVPEPQGLYNPAEERDACGLAMVATLRGTAGHDIITLALDALRNLEHRGAVGSDAGTGDGAGIITQIPDEFLRAVSDSSEGALIECSSSVLAAGMPAGSAVHRQVDPMAASFLRHNGYYPTQAAFDGYAGARLLLRAIADAGSSDPTRVDSALSRLDLATAAGTFKFSARDHRGLASAWIAVAVVKGGKLVPSG